MHKLRNEAWLHDQFLAGPEKCDPEYYAMVYDPRSNCHNVWRRCSGCGMGGWTDHELEALPGSLHECGRGIVMFSRDPLEMELDEMARRTGASRLELMDGPEANTLRRGRRMY